MPWFPKAKSPPRKPCNNNETAARRLQSADRIPGPIQLLVAGRCLPTIDAVLPNLSHGLAHGGPVVMTAVHKALLSRMRNRNSATTRRQLPKYKGLSSMRVSVDGTNFPACAGVHPRPMPHRPERFGPPDRHSIRLRSIRPLSRPPGRQRKGTTIHFHLLCARNVRSRTIREPKCSHCDHRLAEFSSQIHLGTRFACL